jgi:hypothetical protein
MHYNKKHISYNLNISAVKKIAFALIIILLYSPHVQAQSDFWTSPHAYLDQTPPGNMPVKFAPALINDSPFFSMDRCVFSADGKEFYYDRNNTWFSSKDASIQTLKFDGTKWVGPAMMVPNIYAPSFSKDGNTLYFIGGGKGVVTQMRRVGGGWGKPETYINRSYGMYDFMTTNSGNMYASSNVNGSINDYTCYDICVMKPLATGDTSITTLGKPLNTPGFDGDFFVAPDESYIVISAKEHPDYECDLFISYHKKDGTWTNPKSLGAEINNGLAHRWGEYVTPNNKYLFYSYGHGPEDCALYWVRFDNLLESLKQTNFEPYVKDSIPPQMAVVNKQFYLRISDGTFFDDDGNNTLIYAASLDTGGELPAGLKFSAKEKTISGMPTVAGTYKVRVTATDNANSTASSTFLLNVNSVE